MQIIPDRLDQIADQGIREHAAGYGDVIDAAPEYQLVLVRRKRPQRGLWRYSPLVHLVGRDDGKPWAVLRHDAGQHPDVILWAGYRWRLYRARSVGGAGD